MSIMNSKVAMKSVLMMGAAAGLMMAAGGARAQSGGYTFTPVNDPLGVKGTFAEGVNDAGQIVGYFEDSSGVNHGFLDTNGTYTTINA
jgi:probable HAF family extracellular repeat protein